MARVHSFSTSSIKGERSARSNSECPIEPPAPVSTKGEELDVTSRSPLLKPESGLSDNANLVTLLQQPSPSPPLQPPPESSQPPTEEMIQAVLSLADADEKNKLSSSANNELMEPALQLLGLAQATTTALASPSVVSAPASPNSNMALAGNSSDAVEDDGDQGYKRGPWTREEDELLVVGIKQFGYGRWKEIASIIPGRRGKQLKQRWDNTLAAKYVDTQWLQSKVRGEGSNDNYTTQQKNQDALRLFESSDWSEIAQRLTEKAKDGHADMIEALLSHALLSSVNSSSAPQHAISESTNASTDQHEASGSVSESTLITAADASPTSAEPNPALPASTRLSSHPNLPTSSSPVPTSTAPSTFSFADAAALALYAQQLNQQHQDAESSNHATSNAAASAFFSPFSGNDHAMALAAAVAAMASTQGSPQSGSITNNTQNPQTGIEQDQKRQPPAPRKRRRSDPALAETQSAAMSIYASAAPIITTVDNQSQTIYPCLFPNCGKTFARLYNLKSHSRTHTDDRPFSCHVCGASFSRNHDLKRHSKIHGGEKKHRCDGCNKTFSRLDALKRHKSNQRNKPACMC